MVSGSLLKRGITVYTPIRVEVSQWSDRKKKMVSLLASIVFVSLLERDVNMMFE